MRQRLHQSACSPSKGIHIRIPGTHQRAADAEGNCTRLSIRADRLLIDPTGGYESDVIERCAVKLFLDAD